MTAITPQVLTGNWHEGYALDLHTVSSDYIGDDPFGHPQFDTKRTEIGELLYKAKNRGSETALDQIVPIAVNFIKQQGWAIELLIPTPPSNATRKAQPVIELARKISSALRIPVCTDCISKLKDTAQLKNVYEAEKRRAVLKDAFSANPGKLAGKIVLLLDDLYRSGTTLNEITGKLLEEGKVKRVYVLTITKTRRNR